MNFGQLAASSTAGTVILDYANDVTKTGGVKLLSAASVKTAVVMFQEKEQADFLFLFQVKLH